MSRRAAAPALPATWRDIYGVVRRIPAGRVATYGQVAALAGLPGQARLVGYALHAVAVDDGRIPWHRVLNARGTISLRGEGPGGSVLQRLRLEQEGVHFDGRGRVDFDRVRWTPPAWRRLEAQRSAAREAEREGRRRGAVARDVD